jgi:hypothetical protein
MPEILHLISSPHIDRPKNGVRIIPLFLWDKSGVNKKKANTP